jgi:hypothetical protein
MKVIQKVSTCLLGALSMISAADAEIKINDMLTIGGFVDMSYVNMDPDTGADSTTATLDQFELNLMFDLTDKLSATVDLEAQSDKVAGTDNEYTTDVEQAYFTYALSDTFSMKAGRFLSYMGWETEDPTGLFQYSGAGYGGLFYGGYQQGVSALYSGGLFDVGLSVVDDIFQTTGVSGNAENLAVEVMVAVYPSESLTFKGFFITDEDRAGTTDTDIFNFWGSYAIGGFTFAAEYSMNDKDGATKSEADGFLLMGNYAWDKYGITLRYHGWETEDATGAKTLERSGFTIAPSMAVNDYLLLVAEYRTEDFDLGGVDYDQFALEALISF